MNKSFEGHAVKIKWRRPADDWAYFKVLKVKPRKQEMKLKGMDDPTDGSRHVGDEFWIRFDELRSISLATATISNPSYPSNNNNDG